MLPLSGERPVDKTGRNGDNCRAPCRGGVPAGTLDAHPAAAYKNGHPQDSGWQYGSMTSIGTKFYTWRFGELVGEDSAGNKYYREKKPRKGAPAKRWVVYADGAAVEASLVPPEWHAWLHRYTDEPPKKDERRWPWQKPHEPNHTGTPLAYRPLGHDLSGGQRARASGDYEAWTPGD